VPILVTTIFVYNDTIFRSLWWCYNQVLLYINRSIHVSRHHCYGLFSFCILFLIMYSSGFRYSLLICIKMYFSFWFLWILSFLLCIHNAQYYDICNGLTDLPHAAVPFLRSCLLCSYSRTSQHFMEPEWSLPCSQEPSTGTCPESDQSSPS
jgi:hypothetical protein